MPAAASSTKSSSCRAVGFNMPESQIKAKENKPPEMPRSLRPFVGMYRAVPRFHVPPTDFDVSFTIVSFLVLSIIRIIIFQALLFWGWPSYSKMTTDAAASLTSIIHSLVLIYGTFECLISHPKYVPSAKLSAAPIWWQDAATALLEMCTGYMLFDGLWLVKDCRMLGLELSEFEMLVLGHHLATSLYMMSARIVGAGHLSAIMLMFCGEISNPFMNGLFVTRFAIKLRCCNGPLVQALHTFLEPAYAIVYAYFRMVLGPLAAVHLTYDLLIMPHGRKNVPFLLSLIWVALVWAVMFGSVPFVKEAIDMLSDGLVLKYHEDYDYGERYRHDEL